MQVKSFVTRTMWRRRILRIFTGRKALACTLVALALFSLRSFSQMVARSLLPPPPPDQNLHLYRTNRNLASHLDNINLLIEPSSACELVQVPVLIMVTSPPSHVLQRDVIRNTWGKLQKTYFYLGLSDDDDLLADTYAEAKQHSDMVVHNFQDHYQNLTLKVALMLQWALNRCPHAKFMFKTDDDVMVNPWMLKNVLKENNDAAMLGYKKENMVPHRDEYTKWFLPRWLYPEDDIAEYLSGTGYIINGKYLEDILKAALRVPLINLEDVHFTYLVAKKTLGLTLTHDRRLSPYKPWVPVACAYFSLASIHSVTTDEVLRMWPYFEELGKLSQTKVVCKMLKFLSRDLFLY